MKTAQEISTYLERLFPLCRSLTGEGNQATFKILAELIPLKLTEIPSGTPCFDWTIPEEWHIRDAWIKGARGEKIVDFQKNNLHVVSYSTPVPRQRVSFAELKPYLHVHPQLPQAIPYRTSYYKKNWGFCLTQQQYQALEQNQGELEICIEASHKPGHLTIGEVLLPGKSEQEILISTYMCHPSMANDNLSGVLVAAFLCREMRSWTLNYSYRFVFVPETIGAIAYCSLHPERLKTKTLGGLILSNVGGPGNFSYKRSFDGDHDFNFLIEDVLNNRGFSFTTYPFDIHGSDERQYSSQGFRINTPSIHKDKYYEFAQYHSSLDNLEFVKGEALDLSLSVYEDLLKKIDANQVYKTAQPHGEIMLSKYDLYPSLGGAVMPDANDHLNARLWLLFHCDGSKTIAEISKLTKISFDVLASNAKIMAAKGVLVAVF